MGSSDDGQPQHPHLTSSLPTSSLPTSSLPTSSLPIASVPLSAKSGKPSELLLPLALSLALPLALALALALPLPLTLTQGLKWLPRAVKDAPPTALNAV